MIDDWILWHLKIKCRIKSSIKGIISGCAHSVCERSRLFLCIFRSENIRQQQQEQQQKHHRIVHSKMFPKLIIVLFAIICLFSVSFAWVGRSAVATNPGKRHSNVTKAGAKASPKINLYILCCAQQFIQANVGQTKQVRNIRRVNHSRCHWDALNTFVMLIFISICMGSYHLFTSPKNRM